MIIDFVEEREDLVEAHDIDDDKVFYNSFSLLF